MSGSLSLTLTHSNPINLILLISSLALYIFIYQILMIGRYSRYETALDIGITRAEGREIGRYQ